MEYDIEKILQTYEDDYNPDPRPMVQEPRNNYFSGKLVTETAEQLASKIFKPKPESTTVKPSILRREAAPLDLSQINEISKNKEFEQAWKNYKISIRKVGRRKYNKDQFFEMWARENMAQGGRTGYYQGGSSETIQPEYDYDSADMGPGGYPLTANMNVIKNFPTQLKPAKDYVIGLLNKIKPYGGSTKGIGTSTPKADVMPERDFTKNFITFKDNYFDGNVSAASEAIGQNRNKIKGIFDRLRLRDTGSRAGSEVGKSPKMTATISVAEDATSYPEATTLMKNKPEVFKNLLKKKDEYVNQKSLGHYLKMKFERDTSGVKSKFGKSQYDAFGNRLRDLGVKSKNTLGGEKQFSINDAIKKMVEGSKNKLVKGQRVNKLKARNERELDPELFDFRASLRNRVANLSKSEDIFLPNAIDDVGHPFSLTRSTKFKNLFKDSNINKLNTLVYQDKFLNQDLFKLTGYEAKYVNMFKDLEKLRNKPVTKETQKKLLEIKNKMNNNYNYIVRIVSDPKKVKNLINKKEKRINDSYANYISGQTDRIQKIDINIPKIGEKFKSQDLFVDMSKVNPNYIMGYVDKINPNAKTLKDLSMSEIEIFKANARSQNADIVANFYNEAKFGKKAVEEVREKIAYDYAEGGRIPFAGGGDTKKILNVLAKDAQKPGGWIGGDILVSTIFTGNALLEGKTFGEAIDQGLGWFLPKEVLDSYKKALTKGMSKQEAAYVKKAFDLDTAGKKFDMNQKELENFEKQLKENANLFKNITPQQIKKNRERLNKNIKEAGKIGVDLVKDFGDYERTGPGSDLPYIEGKTSNSPTRKNTDDGYNNAMTKLTEAQQQKAVTEVNRSKQFQLGREYSKYLNDIIMPDPIEKALGKGDKNYQDFDFLGDRSGQFTDYTPSPARPFAPITAPIGQLAQGYAATNLPFADNLQSYLEKIAISRNKKNLTEPTTVGNLTMEEFNRANDQFAEGGLAGLMKKYYD